MVGEGWESQECSSHAAVMGSYCPNAAGLSLYTSIGVDLLSWISCVQNRKSSPKHSRFGENGKVNRPRKPLPGRHPERWLGKPRTFMTRPAVGWCLYIQLCNMVA